jgi:hypothetical protein
MIQCSCAAALTPPAPVKAHAALPHVSICAGITFTAPTCYTLPPAACTPTCYTLPHAACTPTCYTLPHAIHCHMLYTATCYTLPHARLRPLYPTPSQACPTCHMPHATCHMPAHSSQACPVTPAPQDPDRHSWLYFTSVKGTTVFLDLSVWPYKMGMCMDAAPCLTPTLRRFVQQTGNLGRDGRWAAACSRWSLGQQGAVLAWWLLWHASAVLAGWLSQACRLMFTSTVRALVCNSIAGYGWHNGHVDAVCAFSHAPHCLTCPPPPNTHPPTCTTPAGWPALPCTGAP